MSKLPDGWTSLPLEYAGAWSSGATPSKSNPDYWTDGSIPWVSPKDMKRDYISKTEDYITEAALVGRTTKVVPENSILIVTRSGILKHTLPVAVATTEVAINQDLKALSPFPGIETDYLLYHLKADAEKILSASAKAGTTVDSLDFKHLKAYPLRIAPTVEQKRIVAKINSLTRRTRQARTDLDRIPALVEKYKRRLLADIFSREQRTKHATFNTYRKTPHRELATLCVSLTDGDHQAPPRTGEGIPFITISAINTGKIDLKKATRFVSQEYYENLKPERNPEKGDVLFSVTGTIGIPALVRETVPFVFQRHIAILRPNPQIISSEYLAHILAAPQVMEQVLTTATGTAQLTVPLGELRKFKIPVPPLSEQTEIVHRVETAFGWLERMAAYSAASNKLTSKLDAAILSKAFSGKLTFQDQSDEPASQILVRITAAREFARDETKHRQRSANLPRTTKRKPTMTDLIAVLKSKRHWMLAADAAYELGIGNGSTSDAVEEFYSDLRARLVDGSIEVQRRGDEDWLRLSSEKVG